jgi:hypothetical protein
MPSDIPDDIYNRDALAQPLAAYGPPNLGTPYVAPDNSFVSNGAVPLGMFSPNPSSPPSAAPQTGPAEHLYTSETPNLRQNGTEQSTWEQAPTGVAAVTQGTAAPPTLLARMYAPFVHAKLAEREVAPSSTEKESFDASKLTPEQIQSVLKHADEHGITRPKEGT